MDDGKTYNGYELPAFGQNRAWCLFIQGTPRIYSPRNSNPNATDRAVHNILKKTNR